MTQEEQSKRQELKNLVIDLDGVAMEMVKFLIDSTPELTHLENYYAHNLNTILENNRIIIYSLDRKLTMTTGSSVRNLFENWANLNYVLHDPVKTNNYAAKITDNAFIYARTLERLVKGEVTVDELYALPAWTNSTITQRMKMLGDGQVYQYELLSRYTHADMWAALNDIIARKEVFWSTILGWGIEAANHTIYLIFTQAEFPEILAKKVEHINERVQKEIVNIS